MPTGGTATFGASRTTSLSFSAATVGGFTINSGTYDFTNNGRLLSFTGSGITINGGSVTFTGGSEFYNSSSAGSASFDTTGGGINFWDSSTAAECLDFRQRGGGVP